MRAIRGFPARLLGVAGFAAWAAAGAHAVESGLTLYETDFGPVLYQSGVDKLVGSDGWTGSNVGQEVHGIDTDIFIGWGGQTAFLGFNTPSFPPQTPRFVEVARPVIHDPVMSEMPIVQFSMIFSIIDSNPVIFMGNEIFRRDRFYVVFKNRDGDTLAALDFDNTEAGFGIWRNDGTTETHTGAFFFRDELGLLDVEINFATNTWTVSLNDGKIPVFESEQFTATGNDRDLGEIALLWEIVQNGDNWILFDDMLFSAFGPDPFKVGNVSVGAGGEVTLAWDGEPGYAYQVEYSDDFRTWRTDLPGSSKMVDAGPESLEFTDVSAPPNGLRYYRIVRTAQQQQ